MPLLLCQTGPDKGRRFFFERNAQLGRGPLADLEVRDPAVSRRHALITVQDGRCFVSDLQSGNGTYLNGQRVAVPTALADGDQVRVGSTSFLFRSGDERAGDRGSSSRASVRPQEAPPRSRSVVVPLAKLHATGGGVSEDELARLRRRLDFFHEAGRVLARSLEEPQLASELLARAMDVLPQADRAFVVLWDEETRTFRPLAGRTRGGGAADIPASRTLLEEVARKREALVSIDAAGESGFEAAKSLRLLALRAVACVPLTVEDRLLGVLQVDNVQAGRGFGADDLDLLEGIAGPIALALEHARAQRRLIERELVEHDLALAQRIQASFLPARLPEVEGWRFAVEYSPALAVGGDLYDLVRLADGRLAFAIGDVSGKGVSGALMMARLTSALRAAAARSPDPAGVIEELNELIRAESEQGMFVTLAFGVLDPASGRIEIANAGHLRPIVRHADGRSAELQVPAGAALGVKKRAGAATFAWTLERGEMVVLVTDGLTEAATPAGARFEPERVVDLVGRTGPDPRQALDALLKAARAFVAERGFDDDLPVLCLARS